METLGVALLVGGMAFLFSGLVFLLPTERKISSRMESFEETQQQIEYYLSQTRKPNDDL
jgi:Na+-transporting methylmalonyl-CoA/oxaloacetate decarboxylase gamma subunit